MNGEGADPRLLQAVALLRSTLDSPPIRPRSSSRALFPGLSASSYSDLLQRWEAVPGAGMGTWEHPLEGWDPLATAGSSPLDQVGVLARSAQRQAAAAPRGTGSPPGWLHADLYLDDHAAEEAIECLYEFLHAYQRLDIRAAMACIAEDFHTIVDDAREMDRHGLQLDLENRMDRLRVGPVEVSLTEVPEPIPHPSGVLVHCTVCVEAWSPGGAPLDTTLHPLMVLMQRGARGAFEIRALVALGER